MFFRDQNVQCKEMSKQRKHRDAAYQFVQYPVSVSLDRPANMGFKCGCGQLARKPIKVVTETRPVYYFGPWYENRNGDMVRDMVGQGTEIVKEVGLCQRCALILDGVITPGA
jgi:hypothetical protein